MAWKKIDSLSIFEIMAGNYFVCILNQEKSVLLLDKHSPRAGTYVHEICSKSQNEYCIKCMSVPTYTNRNQFMVFWPSKVFDGRVQSQNFKNWFSAGIFQDSSGGGNTILYNNNFCSTDLCSTTSQTHRF